MDEGELESLLCSLFGNVGCWIFLSVYLLIIESGLDIPRVNTDFDGRFSAVWFISAIPVARSSREWLNSLLGYFIPNREFQNAAFYSVTRIQESTLVGSDIVAAKGDMEIRGVGNSFWEHNNLVKWMCSKL